MQHPLAVTPINGLIIHNHVHTYEYKPVYFEVRIQVILELIPL